jgi:hypothetical protein
LMPDASFSRSWAILSRNSAQTCHDNRTTPPPESRRYGRRRAVRTGTALWRAEAR